MVSTLATWSPTAASTSCRKILQLLFRTKLRPNLPQPARAGAAPRESIPPFYLAARRDLFAHGCNSAGRYCWLYPTAGLRLAGSRLSDHSSAHVLSRRQPDGDGDDGDGATGTPIRRTAGFEPDDLHQLRRHFRHCAAVQSHSEY